MTKRITFAMGFFCGMACILTIPMILAHNEDILFAILQNLYKKLTPVAEQVSYIQQDVQERRNKQEQERESYGLPPHVWSACRYQHNGKWILDMTTDYWICLGVTDQQQYARLYQEWYARSVGEPVEKVFTSHDTSFVMCLIPPGRFWMGSPIWEPGRDPDEVQHKVVLAQPFWIGKHEVTQEQWRAVMNNSPSFFKEAGNRAPVEQVSWYGCREFCSLIQMRLPTEEEWEYACRAGSVGMSYAGDFQIFGEADSAGKNNAPGLDRLAWYAGNSGVNYEGGYETSKWRGMQYPAQYSGTHPVCQKIANAWGVHDMLGNVWEWCEDRYTDYQKKAVDGNPSNMYVVRGGSWFLYTRYCRSANRHNKEGKESDSYTGFRVVRSLEKK